MEGLIAEVTLDTARDLGVEWRVIDQPDGTQVFAGATGTTGPDGTGVLANPAALLNTPGFLVGALRNTIRLDVGGSERQLLNIPVLLRGLSEQYRRRGPGDAEPADDGQRRSGDHRRRATPLPDLGQPHPGRRHRERQQQPSTFATTGITLRITPQISKGNTVRTQLFLEITRFVSEAEVGAVTTTKRSTKTTVIVDDGQTIVLGGLIQDTRNDNETRVPFLGDLPLLGGLFRQSGVRSNKTNLLIFLTPHIVSTRDDVERVTSNKQGQAHRPEAIARELREGQPQYNLEWLLD